MKKKNIPNYDNIHAALEKAGNRIFYVKFIKRTTGEEREMICRRKVTKHLKGGSLPYNARANNLITVFEFKTAVSPGGYKAIPVESIKLLKIQGTEYSFD